MLFYWLLFLYIVYLTVRFWAILLLFKIDINLLYFTLITDVGVYILFGIIEFEKIDIDINKS